MKLHKAGYGLLLKIFIIIALINVCVFYFFDCQYLQYTILALTSVFYLLCINFFRSPNRLIKMDDNAIIAPADGKIVVIEEVFESEYLKQNCLQVSIFMNVFNVHINWFPINGIVKYYTHHKGKYMAAFLPKSSTENERSTIVIESNNGSTILMRQVAGALAKRIVTYATPELSVRQNDHAGFIKFGSRVDLYLPLDTKINVELGQKTVGSQKIKE